MRLVARNALGLWSKRHSMRGGVSFAITAFSTVAAEKRSTSGRAAGSGAEPHAARARAVGARRIREGAGRPGRAPRGWMGKLILGPSFSSDGF
jgi:hypothetical protein